MPAWAPQIMSLATPAPAVTAATFDDVVLRSPKPVLVDFTAQWCPPCHHLDPIIAELAAEQAERLSVVTVDVDEQPELANRYGVMSLPSLLLFVAGDERTRLIGAHPKRRILQEVGRVLPSFAEPATEAQPAR
jgi:thioredoxin 1